MHFVNKILTEARGASLSKRRRIVCFHQMHVLLPNIGITYFHFSQHKKGPTPAFNEDCYVQQNTWCRGKRRGDFCQPNTNIEGAGLLSINFRVRWLFYSGGGSFAI